MDKDALSRAFAVLVDLSSRLRAPGGCPWDALQTDSTIRMYVLEEAYEVVDAVERGSPEDVCQELGDLLFQILFLASLGEERGEFDLVDVIEKITEKMRGRHPHVFGEVKVNNAQEVAENWQEIKKKEKEESDAFSTLLQGLPKDLPALLKAHRLSERASRADFDDSFIKEGWGRVEAQYRRLERAVSIEDKGRIGRELGDLLFSMASLAREWGLNAEDLLREANKKHIERIAESQQPKITESNDKKVK